MNRIRLHGRVHFGKTARNKNIHDQGENFAHCSEALGLAKSIYGGSCANSTEQAASSRLENFQLVFFYFYFRKIGIN